MFHDLGLTDPHKSSSDRFENDGANAARDFLRRYRIEQNDIDTVGVAIALHTTLGIPQYMHPVIALLNAGVLLDVIGIGYENFSAAQRNSLIDAYPRGPRIDNLPFDRIRHDCLHIEAQL
jgi:hypothetical protein